MTFLKSKHTNQFLKEHLIIYQRVRDKQREINRQKSKQQLLQEIIEYNEYFINQLVINGYPSQHTEIQHYLEQIKFYITLI